MRGEFVVFTDWTFLSEVRSVRLRDHLSQAIVMDLTSDMHCAPPSHYPSMHVLKSWGSNFSCEKGSRLQQTCLRVGNFRVIHRHSSERKKNTPQTDYKVTGYKVEV